LIHQPSIFNIKINFTELPTTPPPKKTPVSSCLVKEDPAAEAEHHLAQQSPLKDLLPSKPDQQRPQHIPQRRHNNLTPQLNNSNRRVLVSSAKWPALRRKFPSPTREFGDLN
jgi:hypothetical protein